MGVQEERERDVLAQGEREWQVRKAKTEEEERREHESEVKRKMHTQSTSQSIDEVQGEIAKTRQHMCRKATIWLEDEERGVQPPELLNRQRERKEETERNQMQRKRAALSSTLAT